MSTPPPDDDDRLLAELRAAVERHDPTPSRALDGARVAYTWRTVDAELAELAELAFDSTSELDGALVRSSVATAHLSFSSDAATIDLELTPEGIVGQVTPPATAVTLHSRAGEEQRFDCDEVGQFSIEHTPRGPVRLVVHRPTGDVATDWFTHWPPASH